MRKEAAENEVCKLCFRPAERGKVPLLCAGCRVKLADMTRSDRKRLNRSVLGLAEERGTLHG